MDPNMSIPEKRLLKLLAWRSVFHIEFFRDGMTILVIEYNNRPAGGFTIDVQLCSLIDLYRGYAAIVPANISQLPSLSHFIAWRLHAVPMHVSFQREEVLAKYQDQFRVKKDSLRLAELKGLPYMLTTPSREYWNKWISWLHNTINKIFR